MSTKQDLQKKVKDLTNQITQLKRSRKNNRANPTTVSKRNNNVPASSVPTWSGTGRPLRVHQTERIGTITASATAGNFKANAFVINPADSTTFPWLSSIASLFDKYKFYKLKFIFVNNAATSTAGNVSIGVDFDTLDSTPASSVAMSNLAKFKTFAPWKSEELDIPVNRRGNNVWLFTSDANSSAGTNVDLKSYNLGKFFISTEGMSASQTAGYVLVEYDVELLDKNPN